MVSNVFYIVVCLQDSASGAIKNLTVLDVFLLERALGAPLRAFNTKNNPVSVSMQAPSDGNAILDLLESLWLLQVIIIFVGRPFL